METPEGSSPGSEDLEEEVTDLKGMLALAKSDPVIAKELWLSHKANSPSPTRSLLHGGSLKHGASSPPMSRSPMAMERDGLIRAERALKHAGGNNLSPSRTFGGSPTSNAVRELRQTLATLDKLVEQYTGEIDGMAKQQHRWKALVLGHNDPTSIKDLKARHALERDNLEDKIAQLTFQEEENEAILADQEAKLALLRQHIAFHQIPEVDPMTALNSGQLHKAVKERKHRLRKVKALEVHTQGNYDNLLHRAEKELKERLEELEDLQHDATQLKEAHQRMREAGKVGPTL